MCKNTFKSAGEDYNTTQRTERKITAPQPGMPIEREGLYPQRGARLLGRAPDPESQRKSLKNAGRLRIVGNMKIKHVAAITISLVVARETTASDATKKLGAECRAGKEKSCLALVEIAKTHSDLLTRLDAVEKTTNETMLAEIAKETSDFEVCRVATDKVNTKAVLANIASSKATCNVLALRKINDVDTIKHMADNPQASTEVRSAAVERLTDRDALVALAKYSQDKMIRSEALDRLLGLIYAECETRESTTPEPPARTGRKRK